MKTRKISVKVASVAPRTLFLRTGIADGELADGRPVELSISGRTLILAVGPQGGTAYSEGHTVETLDLVDLIASWSAKL